MISIWKTLSSWITPDPKITEGSLRVTPPNQPKPKRKTPQPLLPGDQFGRLTILRELGRGRSGTRIWLWRCSCGKETPAYTGNLRGGRHRSCGCLRRDCPRLTQQGWSDTPTYEAWMSLRLRCSISKGRMVLGPRWALAQDFLLFLADMGERPEGHYLARRDRRKPWDKDNTYWGKQPQPGTAITADIGMSLKEAGDLLGVTDERARQLYRAGRLQARLVVCSTR